MTDITPTADEIFRSVSDVPWKYRILDAPDVPTGLADALREIEALREQRTILLSQMADLSATVDRQTETIRRLTAVLRERQ